MWYHAVTDFGGSTRYWWNRSRDDLISELLIPLLAKQVVLTTRRGKKSLFNFGAVSYVTILSTKTTLKRESLKKSPAELRDQTFINEHNVTEEFVNDIRVLQSNMLNRSLLEQAVSKPLDQIFVIMQFRDPFLDSAYAGVIKPIGESFGYKVLRVDEIQDGGHISGQILENIAKSKIVLAELSGARPNCYYEAGYSHALGKEVIFVIRKNEKIHFDLAGHRFIQWETELELRNQLSGRLDAIAHRDERD